MLGGAYGSSDESSSSEEEDKDETEAKEQTNNTVKLANPFGSSSCSSSSSIKLPRPSFMAEQEDMVKPLTGRASSSASVFGNPFRESEDRKRAVLEKHVAMTARQEERKTIDGKKVCWNFRKGRCRFGHKCTFAHDSDIGLKKPEAAPKKPDISAEPSSGQVAPPPQPPPAAQLPVQSAEFDEGSVISGEDTQGYAAAAKKKKRPGLSQDLTPSKKAMKFHNKVYNNADNNKH